MMKAVMTPQKIPLQLAIPPPEGYPVPEQIQNMRKVTPEELEQARKKFIKTIEEQYYLEWFWFPYCNEVWVNTWRRIDIEPIDKLDPYPSNYQTHLQWVRIASLTPTTSLSQIADRL